MTLQQLKYFLEITRQGSMNKAAEELYISQPSLTAAIKELEWELHLTLFLRSSRGVTLTAEGREFLGYARQVLQQQELLEAHFLDRPVSKRLVTISTQHYAFAVNAFVNLVKRTDAAEYAYTLRETRTEDIINDVKNLSSELGILYMSDFNRPVMSKILKDANLIFHSLFTAKPHIFVSDTNPLSSRKSVTLKDLEDFPRLSFDQSDENSFYFAEEILSTESVKKDIKVGDRATIFNLMIGLDGYTISTGLVSSDLNGEHIVSIPLDTPERIEVGWISHASSRLTAQAEMYLEELSAVIRGYGIDLA